MSLVHEAGGGEGGESSMAMKFSNVPVEEPAVHVKIRLTPKLPVLFLRNPKHLHPSLMKTSQLPNTYVLQRAQKRIYQTSAMHQPPVAPSPRNINA